MNVTILCSGPGLANYKPDDSRIILAVNRAATAHHCHCWVCTDYPLALGVMDQVKGRPKLVTSASCRNVLDGRYTGRVQEVEGLLGLMPPEFEWTLFSATIALAYASKFEPEIIHVYGANWSGTEDFDGWDKAGNRSVERWKLERAIWCNRLVPFLFKQGITVHRHE